MPVAVPVAVPQTKALLDSLRGAGADVDHTKIFAEHGFNKLHFAFDPKYIPWINPMLVAPQDLLHSYIPGRLATIRVRMDLLHSPEARPQDKRRK